MHTQSLSHLCGRSWIHNSIAFQLSSERGREKKCSAERRNHWDQHGVVNTRLSLPSLLQKIKVISWSHCYYFGISDRTRILNYIVKILPCCHRLRTATKSERAFLKHSTWLITCCLVFTLALDEQRFLYKKQRKVGRSPMADPERRLWEGRNFREGLQFLKSNRISLSYDLTSNIDQTLKNKSCFVFLLYRGIYRFCAIFGRHGRVWPPWIRLWWSVGSCRSQGSSPPPG